MKPKSFFHLFFLLLSIGLGLFIVVIDSTILNIALPSISQDFQSTFSTIQWTIIAYSLCLTALVPIFGRVGDIYGRKKLYLFGQVFFLLGSLLAGMSTDIVTIIGARVLQSLGGAMITSNTLAIIADSFEKEKRGMVMGLQAILISGGAAIGPTLGGFIVTHFGWRWIFFINIPIGIVSILLGLKFLEDQIQERRKEDLDWLGAFLLFLGVGSFLLAITEGGEWGWWSPRILLLAFGGLLFQGVFFWRQTQIKHPLLDLSLLKIRSFVFGQLAGVFAMSSISMTSFLFPFYWQTLRGFSAQKTGLLMLPLPLGIMFMSPFAGKLSDYRGARLITTLGLLVVAFGFFMLTFIHSNSEIFDVLWRIAFVGIGLGMFLAPNNNSIISSVPNHRRGVAAGFLGMFRYSGQSIGVALGGTIFATAIRWGTDSTQSVSDFFTNAPSGPAQLELYSRQFETGFHYVFIFGVFFGLLGALLSAQRS